MKRILVLLFLISLNCSIGYCQQLSNPSLKLEDFEIALTNAGHLRNILKTQDFEYSAFGETKLIAPGKMPNPLLPDLRAFRSERWEPKNQGDQAIVEINIYEWEPDYAPQPEVIKTIRVMIRRNSTYADIINVFLKEIKNKYPNRSKRYFRNSELYKSFGESFYAFTNDSKIEVRTETEDPEYYQFCIVNFDLIR